MNGRRLGGKPGIKSSCTRDWSKHMADTGQDFGTVIGPDATFKGDLSFDGAAKVLGTIEGSIKSKGRVHVAQGANCHATIEAKEVAVEGQIHGNVQANERIELKPNGAVIGDIIAARMSMADGASIDGHVRIGVNGASTGKATAAVESKQDSTSKATATAKKG